MRCYFSAISLSDLRQYILILIGLLLMSKPQAENSEYKYILHKMDLMLHELILAVKSACQSKHKSFKLGISNMNIF